MATQWRKRKAIRGLRTAVAAAQNGAENGGRRGSGICVRREFPHRASDASA
ncbi:MAG: hypothetical protein QM689_00500 [Oscillospiraceae bacterium]